MGSMRSCTPFFSMTVSSSFFTSSKVNPYWKPEQPPPVTNTRSLSSVLPSSSISCFTLLAALSVKTSGAGISVTAFMCISCPTLSAVAVDGSNRPSVDGGGIPRNQGSIPGLARRELQLDGLGLPGGVRQPAVHDRPEMHLEHVVLHVSFDAATRLQFEELGRV